MQKILSSKIIIIQTRGSRARKVGSGGHNCNLDNLRDLKLGRHLDQNTVSQRKFSRKLEISAQPFHRVLEKYSIGFYQGENVPESTHKPIKAQKRGLIKCYREWLGNKLVVTDDESYFTLSDTSCAGNRSYFSTPWLKLLELFTSFCRLQSYFFTIL